MENYTECNIEEYTFIATLDLRTSTACQKQDRKSYKVKDNEPGTNCPPMHPNCRSTTIMKLDDEVMESLERRARDPKTGKNKKVKGNQSYDQWIKEQESKYGKDNLEILKKKPLNLKSDRKQYDRYANTLGKEHMPKTLAEFQKLKYNSVEEWKATKRTYSKATSIQEQVDFSHNGKSFFVPANTKFSSMPKSIAGKGSDNGIKDIKRLIDSYGGNEKEWSKKVAKIESDLFVLDIHWYEYEFVKYDAKVSKSKMKE